MPLRTSFGTADSVSGSGTVALIAREILYVAKALSGTGSVANVPYSVDRIPGQPVALDGAGAVANVPYTVFKVGYPQAINGAGSMAISLTHGGRVVLSTRRTNLRVMDDWLYLLRIDNLPITEQNRKFGMTEMFNTTTVQRSDGKTTRFYPEDYNKKIFKFSWKFIANDQEGNFDYLRGRDYLKSVADADSIHTLGLRRAQTSTFDVEGDYQVVVRSYNERLVRRAITTAVVNGVVSDDAELGKPLHSDSKYGKYFWDVDMEFEQV